MSKYRVTTHLYPYLHRSQKKIICIDLSKKHLIQDASYDLSFNSRLYYEIMPNLPRNQYSKNLDNWMMLCINELLE